MPLSNCRVGAHFYFWALGLPLKRTSTFLCHGRLSLLVRTWASSALRESRVGKVDHIPPDGISRSALR